jgi:hypothetical protein
VSDDQSTTDEVVETPDVQEPSDTTPTDENDVASLKRALEHERAERREAKEFVRRIREEEDARTEFLKELGYEVESDVEEADDDEPEDEPDVYLTREEYEAEKQERLERESQKQFETDLRGFVGDRELDERGAAWILSKTYKGPEDLEAGVNAWFDWLDSVRGETPKKKQRAPHVVTGGQPVTGTPDYSDMTRDQINEAMFDRARALEGQ